MESRKGIDQEPQKEWSCLELRQEYIEARKNKYDKQYDARLLPRYWFMRILQADPRTLTSELAMLRDKMVAAELSVEGDEVAAIHKENPAVDPRSLFPEPKQPTLQERLELHRQKTRDEAIEKMQTEHRKNRASRHSHSSENSRKSRARANELIVTAETFEDRVLMSGTTGVAPEPAPTQTSTESLSMESDSGTQQETSRLSASELSSIENNTRAGFDPQMAPLLEQQQAINQQIAVLSNPVASGWGSDGTKAPGSIGELYGSGSPHGSYNVLDSVVSPDRTRVITTGNDKTARIVDQQTGGTIKTLSGHTAEVTCVDISSDGKTIVTGSLDRSIKVWDAQTGALQRTITFTNGVQDVEFIDGTNLVAVGVKGSTIRTVDITTGNPSKSFGSSAIPHAFDEMTGQQTLVKNNGTGIQAYDPATGQLKMTYASPMKSYISDVDVSADNQRTAAGARYGEVAIWNAQNGQRITSITTGQGDVTEVQWIDNNLLAIGHAGGAVCIFEINGTSVVEKARYKVPGAVSDIAADPLGTSIIVTTNSGTRGVFGFQAPGLQQKLEAAQNQRTSNQQQIAYMNTQINRAILDAKIAAQNTNYQERVDDLEGMVNTARPDPAEPITTEIISRWRNDLVHIGYALDFTLNEIETDSLLMGTNQRAELVGKLGTVRQAINTTFDEITGLETELQRQQEEAAELAARQESVSALMMSVQQSLESQNSIGYARMEVTTEYNENAGYTRFVVRFRSPEDAVRLTAKVGGSGNEKNFEYISDHPGGTESEVWYFQLMHEENISGQVVIRLTDPVTGRLLDITEGSYSRGYPGNIATQQLPWDQVEQGRLEEEPIAPSLSIVKIEGPNVIFSVQSPNDQSHVGFEGGEGLLSQTLIQHDGGTTFGMAMITFDAALPTGDYYLRMSDRVYGMRQDVVLLHWDKTSRTLSLTDQADALASTPPEGAEDMEAFQAMLNIDTASIADRQINWTEQQRMWEATYNLAAPYNFATIAANSLNSFYELNPQYHPANKEAEITRRWDPNGGFTRGDIERTYEYEVQKELGNYYASNAKYTEAMGEIMQKAVDVYVQIQNGSDQRTQLAQLDDCIRQNWPGGTIYGTNIGIPNRQLILEAGRQIFQNSWRQIVQAEEAVRDLQKALDNRHALQNSGFEVSEDGTYKITDINKYLASLMRDEGVTTLTALQERLSGDADGQAAILALLSGSVENADEMTTTLIATLNQVTDTGIGGYVVKGMNGSDELSPEAQQADSIVSQISQRDIFDEALDWYQDGTGFLRQEFPSRTDTVVGQIMMGGSEKLWMAQSQQEQWEVAIKLQRITDIDAWKFIDVLQRSSSEEAFGQNMKDLMVTAQYGHLFESYRISPTPYVVAAHPNILPPNVYQTSDPIRIRFDAVTLGQEIRRVEVYHNGKMVALTSGSTFVDIPVSKFAPSSENVQVTIKIKLDNGASIEMLSDKFHIDVPFLPNSGGNLNLSTNPDAAQATLEKAVLNILKENFYLDDPSSWNWLIASHAHNDDAFNAVDLSLDGNLDNGAIVSSPFEGEVVYNRKDGQGNSTLVIQHHMSVDGKEIWWYTKYLHMYCDESGATGILNKETGIVTPLNVGQYVNARQQIGNVSNVSNSPMGIHLHQETFMKNGGEPILNGDYFSTVSIDQRLLLTNKGDDALTPGFGISTSAQAYVSGTYNGSSMSVRWDNDLSAWVSDSAKMIYNRSQQEINVEGNDSYWVAWHEDPAMRKSVIFKTIPAVQLPDGTVFNNYSGWIHLDPDGTVWEWKNNNWLKINIL